MTTVAAWLRLTEAALLHAAAVHIARARDAAAAAAEPEEASAATRRAVADAEEALCCVVTNGLEVGGVTVLPGLLTSMSISLYLCSTDICVYPIYGESRQGMIPRYKHYTTTR